MEKAVMNPAVVRPFEGRDTSALLECWARSLPLDTVTLDEFERKVLLDQNYERDSLMVVPAGEGIGGFVVCFVLNKPIEKVGHREAAGFISAMGVDPDHRGKGIGGAL